MTASSVSSLHALLIVEKRLREQQAEGVRMREGMELDELALRILMRRRQEPSQSLGDLDYTA